MPSAPHGHPDRQLDKQKAQNIMNFSRIVTTERQDDQIGKMVFCPAEYHLYRGLYFEMPGEFSDFSYVRRYPCSWDHDLCS
jgi:hypothetical protein